MMAKRQFSPPPVIVAAAAAMWLAGCEDEAARAKTRSAVAPSMVRKAQAAEGDATSCYEELRDETFLSESDAFDLCSGSRSTGPADCFRSAKDETFLEDDSIFMLCRCAESTEPVQCYERTRANTFLSEDEIIELCSAIIAKNLLPNCSPYVPPGVLGVPVPY